MALKLFSLPENNYGFITASIFVTKRGHVKIKMDNHLFKIPSI